MSEEPKRARVLLVDDSEETRTTLEKILLLEDEIEVVGQASNGREALERARELRPDLVLMDVWMPEMDGIEATEALNAELPFVQVVLMSVAGSSDLLRRAMLAGAREYLVKPFGAEELNACLQRVAILAGPGQDAWAPAAPPEQAKTQGSVQGKVIAVAGAKGGSGRTMVACNLAVYLAGSTAGHVALVDACLHSGDVGLALNINSERSLADLAMVAPDELDLPMIEDAMTDHPLGVRVLLAPSMTGDGDAVEPDCLRRVVGHLASAYSFVVVDLSPNANETDLAVLDAADKVVLLYTPEMSSVRALKRYLEIVNPNQADGARFVSVANRMDAAGGVQIKDVEKSLKITTLLGIPTDERLARYSLNKGQPFVTTHAKSALALSIKDLANLLMGEALPAAAGSTTAKVAKRGAFGFLRKRKAS
ncbi:MAG: AAA family ATPase [Chloroflexota bacterium]